MKAIIAFIHQFTEKKLEVRRPMGQKVSYKFNIPGVRNFHLLPFKNKRYFLNTFQPHAKGFNRMTQSAKPQQKHEWN